MNHKTKVTIFYCVNAFDQGVFVPQMTEDETVIKTIKLPCSAMVKDVFLLRAFEAGADGVMILACPKGKCQRIDGNIRAGKRVEWLKKLLNEIGLDGRRLSLSNIADVHEAKQAIKLILAELSSLGPNPARITSAKETSVTA